jgi:hypothetical protein
MAYWTSWIHGGESYPKVELLDSDGTTIVDTLTLNFTDVKHGISIGPERDEKIPEEKSVDIAISKTTIEKWSGYRFYGNYSWKWISKTDYEMIQAIINHRYKVKWYPHQDNTSIWFICSILPESEAYGLEGGTTPVHRGYLALMGSESLSQVPVPMTRMHVCKAGDYAAMTTLEKTACLHILKHADWIAGTHTDAEALVGHISRGSIAYENGKECLPLE